MTVRSWGKRGICVILLLGSGAGGVGAWRAWNDTGVVSVPAEVRARPGRLTVIRAEAPANVVWHACAAGQPPDLLSLEDGRAVVFVAGPGRYELIAWSAAGGQPTGPAKCVVHVEAEPPPDALAEKLRAAWSQDTSPQRNRHRELLAGLYRAAAADTVNLPSIRTAGELFDTLGRAARTLLPDDALPALRAAVGDVLRSALPTDPDAALDDNLRRRTAELFRRVAVALSQL